MDASTTSPSCRICGSPTAPVGPKYGAFSGRWYHLVRCSRCHFAFIVDPWLDYTQIYSLDYYAGNGADPSVDYFFELERPGETIRHYEWQGILRVIGHLRQLGPGTRWLDFGCGNGGLVRYVGQQATCQIVGFDEGAIVEVARRTGVPILGREEFAHVRHSFDIVTAIEVLEHVTEPVVVLREIHSLLRPGGLLFFTTGNARPWRQRLLHWRYVIPEIHVSFFEPRSIEQALVAAGFRAEHHGRMSGFDQIIRFKVLKGLGVRRRATWERLLPWGTIARLIDLRYQITAHPVGVTHEV